MEGGYIIGWTAISSGAMNFGAGDGNVLRMCPYTHNSYGSGNCCAPLRPVVERCDEGTWKQIEGMPF